MSALVKAGDRARQSAVQPLGVAASVAAAIAAPDAAREGGSQPLMLPEPSGAIPTTSAPDRALELEAVIADLRGRLADTASDADEREDAAYERGRREAEDLVTGEADKRLALFAKGVEALKETHAARTGEYELLALQLARAALARVFGREDLGSVLVFETIAQRLSVINRELVLALRVSPRDFRTESDLAGLVERFAGIEIAHDNALAAGDCILDLRLGKIDLGLGGQWERLSAFFDDLAEAGA